MIASAECISDFIQRGFGELARQIHRYLSRKSDTGRAPFACHIGQPYVEVFGHTPLNLFDRDRVPSFFLQDIFQQMICMVRAFFRRIAWRVSMSGG